MNVHSRIGLYTPLPTTRTDIPALTGFRFLSALFVLVGHGYSVVPFRGTGVVGNWLGPLASCGMTMFFVLSGFLMWLNYGESYRHGNPFKIMREFAIARFARLYPMLLCTLLLVCMFRTTSVIAALPSALLYPLMVNSWLPGSAPVLMTFVVPAAAHTWSISAEIFCYLLFPAFALIFCHIRSRAVVLGCGLVFLATLLAVAYFGPRHLAELKAIFRTDLSDEQVGMWLTYYSPATRIFEFGIGCLSACYFRARSHATGSVLPIYTGLAAVLGAIIVFANGSLFRNAWALHDLAIRGGVALGSALIVFGVADAPDQAISRVLAAKPVQIGGEISYSTYLLHPFVFAVFLHQPSTQSILLQICEWLLTMVVSFAGIYLISFVTFRLIEVPARRWLKNFLGNRASHVGSPLKNERAEVSIDVSGPLSRS